jgi:energy-coupling factor transporter ATP-binding protein EcfA2
MYLNRIEIENLRAIGNLVLDFGTGANTRRWTVLLGENGCGKSTVLKAIGLVLAGSDALSELLVDVDEWIKNGEKVAKIRAEISTASGEKRALSLEIHRGDGRDSIIRRNQKGLALLDSAVNKADRNYFLAGYGAFRRPPDPEGKSRSRPARINRAGNVSTLFSASSELMSLEEWAVQLDYQRGKKGREIIAEALKSLLPGMHFKTINKKTQRIMMGTIDGDVPLGNLSEGYQAMAAWAGDILYRMSVIFEDWKQPLHARGVLLIDEMDLHLHPVWKRNFVDFLNRAFPNLQIIATTHSPLSVQQCGEGELYVVKRSNSELPMLVPFKGDPSRLRLSELFLSPLIGLDTLDSPRVAALRDEARNIEIAPGRKSAGSQSRLKEIAKQLEGTTPLPVEEAPALGSTMAVQKILKQLLPAEYADRTRLRASQQPGSVTSAPAKNGSVSANAKLPARKDSASKAKAQAKKVLPGKAKAVVRKVGTAKTRPITSSPATKAKAIKKTRAAS